MIAAEGAAVGFHRGDPAGAHAEAEHGGVLHEAAAMVLHGPGVALDGAVRVRVAAEMIVVGAVELAGEGD